MALAVSIVAHAGTDVPVPDKSGFTRCCWPLRARASAIGQAREVWLVGVARSDAWVTDARARIGVKDLVLGCVAVCF